VDERTLAIASFTKSGGSWLTWMLIDILHQPSYFCDQIEKKELDKLISKTEGKTTNLPDIHLIRHPLDICCSAYNYLLLTDRAKQDFDQFVESFCRSKGRVFGKNNWANFVTWAEKCEYQIKYDELCEDPEREIRKILGDIDIRDTLEKYSLEALRKREGKTEFKRPNNNNYTFFNKASSFYYKELMSEKQIEIGNKAFEQQIQKYWPKELA